MKVIEFIQSNKHFFNKATLCQDLTGNLCLELVLSDDKYKDTVSLLASFFLISNNNIYEITIRTCEPCKYSKVVEVLYESSNGD